MFRERGMPRRAPPRRSRSCRERARALGKAYREFRGYSTNLALGVEGLSEIEKVRASAERLGIDTAGMDLDEIKNAMVQKLSNE